MDFLNWVIDYLLFCLLICVKLRPGEKPLNFVLFSFSFKLVKLVDGLFNSMCFVNWVID